MTEFDKLHRDVPTGRFYGIERPYSIDDVRRLRGSVELRYTLAEMGAKRLWQLLHRDDFVNALGALSGNQAMQMVRAGLKAIYLSGWQVAADSNTASAMYPDQSLYPANAGPELAKRINRTLAARRSDRNVGAERPVGRDLVCTDRRRCGGRLWRPVERLRDHEGLYRGGCGRGSLRGPAGIGEEMRPPGRQGSDPDCGPYPQSRCGSSRRRCHGRPNARHRPHRRGSGQAADVRYRRTRPALRRL